jgi:hypothetical protein
MQIYCYLKKQFAKHSSVHGEMQACQRILNFRRALKKEELCQNGKRVVLGATINAPDNYPPEWQLSK